jgi:osmotically-inducible protein OsmY
MAEVHASLRQTLAQAIELPSQKRIDIQLDGDTVVLKGQVANPEERRIVESMVRMTPGVEKVRNELVPQNAEE